MPDLMKGRKPMVIQVEGAFAASHYLPGYKGKCANLHGHRWEIKVKWCDKVDKKTGMICDFKILKSLLSSVLGRYDHQHLNDYFPNPTAENIAEALFDELEVKSPIKLIAVSVCESPGCQVTYRKCPADVYDERNLS